MNSSQILMQLELCSQISEKHSDIFHESLSNGSQVIPCGQVGGQTDMTEIDIRFSQFCERTYKPADIHTRQFDDDGLLRIQVC